VSQNNIYQDQAAETPSQETPSQETRTQETRTFIRQVRSASSWKGSEEK